ncbi:MAG: NapC/NirT family cytochrome c [Ignavibacterium sp.]|nr:NapC/NirT family cytochrome c [Ignavibacterium sp.]
MRKILLVTSLLFLSVINIYSQKAGNELLGAFKYDDFKTPEYCGASCHADFYQQWKQAMMSQAFTHHWDEIEYFELAVPHAEKDPVVAEVKAGCNGCHSPIAFASGDIPPKRPEFKTRANEGVSCDVCHSISGFKGDVPYNFNYILNPGNTKYGTRGTGESPEHQIQKNDFLSTAEFCGTCHNEKSPYDVWVKSTHLEWKEGPYSKQGVTCQTCHMPPAEGYTAAMGNKYADARQHLFHGAHDPGKVQGTVELRIHPDLNEAEPGETVKFTVALFNAKTGHKFPSGSVEDRIVWMHVEAVDAAGKVYHLKVDKKGFAGEEFTIASDDLAYQDMSIAKNDPNFKGVRRDGDVPVGDRIFRMAYFDPQGRMTIQQWNTKSLGTDYRIGPRETKLETLTFNLPTNVAPGKMKITATLYYQRLVPSVAKFLNVPSEEYETIKVNEHTTYVTVLQ